MPDNIFFKVLLLSVLLWSVAACSDDKGEKILSASVQLSDGADEWQTVPLPDVSRQPVRLSVASVVNSRFKPLSDTQIKKILLRTQQLVKQHFNIDVEFSGVKTFPVEDIFSRLEPEVIAERSAEIVDIDLIDKQVREKMQQALFQTLTNYAAGCHRLCAAVPVTPRDKAERFYQPVVRAGRYADRPAEILEKPEGC